MNYVPRLLKLTGAATLLFALFFSGLFSAPATYAASPVTVGAKATVTNTDGDTIRIRSAAGTTNEQVAEAYEGQVVTVLAGPSKDAKGNVWYKIDAPDGTGWMMSEFLTGTASTSAKPAAAKSQAPAAAPSAPSTKLTGFARVANTDGDPLRVRSTAGTRGGVLTTLQPGASVAVKAGPVVDSEKITWYQISASGVTGWAMGQYLVQSKAPAAAVAETKPAAPVQAPAAPAAEPAKPAAQPAVVQEAKPVQPEQAATTDAARSGTSRGAEPPAEAALTRNNAIVNTAMKYVGYRYRFGGSSPSGFDCSGFVYYVVNRAGGSVGRTIPYQINSGTRISRSDLQPGDLLFFSNTYKRGLSHAGIYIGNGKFIHAQNERTGVLVSSLNTAYWSAHYTGATRTR